MASRSGTCCILIVVFAAFSQTPEPVLESGSMRSEHLQGDQERIYSVHLDPNRTMGISITDLQGFPGVLTLLGRDGRELATADLSQRTPSAKTILIAPGTARIVVKPASRSPVERFLEIRAGDAHSIEDADRSRITAEHLLGRGEYEFRHKTPGYRERALSAYQQSLEIWRRLGDRRREADVRCHIGRVDYQLADYNAQREQYSKALELSTSENDPAGRAEALCGRALAGQVTSYLIDAEKWANQALEISRSLDDLRGQAEALAIIDGIQFIHGKFAESKISNQAAIDLAERSGDRLCEADVRNVLGVIESQLGDRDAALSAYRQALEIDKEENDPVQAAQALSNIGAEYGKAGDNREAVQALEEVLPVRKALSSPSSYGNTIYNLAIDYKNLGEYEKAFEGFQGALKIFRETQGTRGVGFALREIGLLYLSVGELNQAEDFLRQSAAQWRSISDLHGELTVTDSLAELALDRGDVGGSVKLLNSVLTSSRTAGLLREQERTLALLARCDLQRGEARLAAEHAAMAEEVSRKIPDRAGEADAIHQEGRAWHILGDDAKAREAFNRSLEIHRATEEKPGQVEDLIELARLDDDAEKVDQALTLFQSIGPGAFRLESRIQFAARYRKLFDLGIDIRMRHGDTAGAFALSERARARGLANLLRERGMDIRAGVDAALLSQEHDLSSAMDLKEEHLAQMLSGPHSAAREADARADLRRAVSRYHDVEAEIRRTSPRYAALVEPPALTAAEAQHELPYRDTMLLEYWLTAERSYLWVVSRASIDGYTLPGRAGIESLARRAYAALDARNIEKEESLPERKKRVDAADSEFDRISVELGRILLGPVRDMSRCRRLWIVSDGALEYLPFAALADPRARAPLIAAHEIERLSSASIAGEVRTENSRPALGLSIAIVADPVFRLDDARLKHAVSAASVEPPRLTRDVDPVNLPRLYFSREEANVIAAMAPGKSRLILDFDASRPRIMQQVLRDYRVVHFATHAFLDSKTPELSGLALSMVDRDGHPQDGFLHLYEVYNLQLNADLVVLSACRTALGTEVRSEGMIGLTRGFMYAGARQVVASLWGIRDNSTMLFMTQFYTELLKFQHTPAASLRATQLSMMKDPRWRQPYYWAAFTLQGADWSR